MLITVLSFKDTVVCVSPSRADILRCAENLALALYGSRDWKNGGEKEGGIYTYFAQDALTGSNADILVQTLDSESDERYEVALEAAVNIRRFGEET